MAVMEKKLKTLLFDPVKGKFYNLEIPDSLEAFYDKLDVRCIELVERCIGYKFFQIMCDEEGLLKKDPVESVVDPWGEQCPLVGKVMFFNYNGKGDLLSLTEDDRKVIRKAATTLINFATGQVHKVVTVQDPRDH